MGCLSIGHRKEQLPDEPGWNPPPENRSVEYDTLSPDYAEFLLTEILPEVYKEYNITDDPEGHAICGVSSGGICAFTVAWERPDQFRKVLSHVGSFVNIRGGHYYPADSQAQGGTAIRVFLQDGSNDLDNQHGNWSLGNKQMYAALKFRDYDALCLWRRGHNGNHGGSASPCAGCGGIISRNKVSVMVYFPYTGVKISPRLTVPLLVYNSLDSQRLSGPKERTVYLHCCRL